MNEFGPLLADIGDVIKVVVVVTIIFLSIASQLVSKWREAQKPQPAPNRPPKPPGPPGPMAAGGQPRAQGDFAEEIAEFLRRAAQQQQGGAARGAPPRQVAAAPRQPGRPAAPRPRSPAARRPATQPPSPVVEAEVASGVGATSNRGTSGPASTLAPPGGAADAAASAAADVPGELPVTAAAGFAVLLSNAESVAQAIVLSEILNRPTDRWE